MICPSNSSDLISYLCPIPPLVLKIHQALAHLRAIALVVCFASSTPSPGAYSPSPHLSGLGSNSSISVRSSKNSLRWHHLFPT